MPSSGALSAALPPHLAVLDDGVEAARFSHFSGSSGTSDTSGTAGTSMATSFLRLGGVHCAACATTIEQALRQVPGVVAAQVSAAARCATVRWEPALTRPSALVEAIARAGYEAVPDTSAGARTLRRSESRDALWRLFVAAFCAMQVMMLAAPSYVAGDGELAPDLARLLTWGSWLLTLPVMLFSARPFVAGAWRTLRRGRIGMDVPAALGMVVAFVAGSGAAFDPGGVFGREVYFDSLTMFIAFLLAGRWLEMAVRHRAEAALEDSVGRMPEVALRENADGSAVPVSVLRLERGDVVRVPLGQAFGADGVILRGSTRADESLLTGEAAPVEKELGDAIVAGSLNVGAPVAMRVERVGSDTRFEAIVAMMREARTRRPEIARAGDRWAGLFLWAVLLLAGAAAAAWSVIDPPRAVAVAVSVLIVTCPCALSLAVPSALLAATMSMARGGVLLRRVEAIERLAQMQRLFLDKTGTLTEPVPAGGEVREVEMVRTATDAGLPEPALRAIAASLAAWSTHPLARALAAEGLACAASWTDLAELPGQGIQGRASDGSLWQLGKAVDAYAAEPAAADMHTWLSRDGRTVAAFRFVERLRPGVREAVRALRDDGVEVVLLSGDAAERVAQVARRLDLREHHGGMTPAAKLEAVRAAQARGERVGMIGDGINDAPVLAQADCSLAMGEGAQIARAQADGVLVSNALGDVVRARALAKRTLRIVRQNLAWAGAYNAACVPLALIGWLPPWAAGLGMACSSLVVVLNSLRLAR